MHVQILQQKFVCNSYNRIYILSTVADSDDLVLVQVMIMGMNGGGSGKGSSWRPFRASHAPIHIYIHMEQTVGNK